MHYYQGQGYTILRDAQITDPGYVQGTDVTVQVLGQLPSDPRLVDPSLLPIPPQGILPPVPGTCVVLQTADLLPADITQPLPPDYVDVS
jgi:hypothetical protein